MVETVLHRDRKRVEQMKAERTSFDPHWRDIAEMCMPRKSRFHLSDTNRGDKRHQKIINSVAIRALRTLSSGMMAGLTSPARPWFRLQTRDPALQELATVKEWLHQCEGRIREKYNRSNLYNVLPGFYRELGAFGTAAMAQLEDAEETFRFYPFTVGSYWMALDHTLKPDTFARQFRLTTRQAVDKFGINNVSPSIAARYREGSYESWVDYTHLVERNLERDQSKVDNQNMPYRGAYWDDSSGDTMNHSLLEGFNEFPILTARWDVTGEDIYGSSPGMDALGDMRALQLQEKRKAQAIDKVVSPPMVADASARSGSRMSLLPDSITFVPGLQNTGGIRPAYEVKPDLDALREDIQLIEKRIEQAFYSDLFLMTALSDRRDVTATEIAERHEEKLMALGPILERLNDEVFDPLLDRTMSIMFRAGQLPPPPRELAGQELKVEYINMLSQSQKLIQSSGIERFATFVGNMAALNPQVLDKWDMDQTVDEYGSDVGVAPKIVRTDDQVAEVREGREQEKRMASMAAMAEPARNASQAVQNLAEANEVGGGSMTEAFTAAMGGMNP